jgi:hypothetical protein
MCAGREVDAIEAGIPCPTYYSHILPKGTNPIHALRVPTHLLAGSPPSRNPLQQGLSFPTIDSESEHTAFKQPVAISLIQVHATVPSIYGRIGVQQYVWIARCDLTSDACVAELGVGWAGEWVLEVEGTPEGRTTLERDILGIDRDGRIGHTGSGSGRAWNWEVVLDKCDEPLLWLRFVTPSTIRSDPTS